MKKYFKYDVFGFDWRVYGKDYVDVCRGVGSGGLRMMMRGDKRSVGGWREKRTRRRPVRIWLLPHRITNAFLMLYFFGALIPITAVFCFIIA